MPVSVDAGDRSAEEPGIQEPCCADIWIPGRTVWIGSGQRRRASVEHVAGGGWVHGHTCRCSTQLQRLRWGHVAACLLPKKLVTDKYNLQPAKQSIIWRLRRGQKFLYQILVIHVWCHVTKQQHYDVSAANISTFIRTSPDHSIQHSTSANFNSHRQN